MSPASPRVERRKKETKERIARVAMELFVRKGLEATTVADIAEAADIGKGTFFSYFPTKESVLVGVGDMLLELMHAGERKARPRTASAAVRAFILPACRWHEDNPELSRAVLTAISRHPTYMDEDASVLGFFQHLLELLARGQASGEFTSEVRVDDAALALFGAYFMGLLLWHRTGRQDSVVERMERTMALTLRGLRP